MTRETIFDQLKQKCAVSGSWTALVGLGGVGSVLSSKTRGKRSKLLSRKSQLAVAYAYQAWDRSRQTWVFWVHASNAARFEQSYRDIADCVKIAGRQDPNANILKLVHDWLRSSKTRWVLILDNVDDASFLFNTSHGQGSVRPLRVSRSDILPAPFGSCHENSQPRSEPVGFVSVNLDISSLRN